MAWVTRDDDAPHQIRIWMVNGTSHVSCTCREVDHMGANYHNPNRTYESMGSFVTGDLKRMREIFNDPSNHEENQGQTFGTPLSKGA